MEEETDLYDEFGNYIGPEEELEGEGVENFDGGKEEEFSDAAGDEYEMNTNALYEERTRTSAMVLQEDKKYFPSAMEVYGESVQVLVEEEDAQPLTEPIIAPIREILIDSSRSHQVPSLKYSLE